MDASDDARQKLRNYFDGVSPNRFREDVERFAPELLQLPVPGQGVDAEPRGPGQLLLFTPPSTPLRLQAYLACALSGLTADQRLALFHVSDIVATICESCNIELYEPRKKTDPVNNPEISDSQVWTTDRERVVSSDLLIHLAYYPSTGSGEELDFAVNALVPCILIHHSENRVSRMVTGIPGLQLKITYSDPEDLRHELKDRLIELRPILEERKLAFSGYRVNIVGARVRALREDLQLTREEVANAVPSLTSDRLRTIEESSDLASDPSLIHLRQLATVLKTTVADLVEPDLDERLMARLQGWLGQRVSDPFASAARFPGMSRGDQNKLIRRLLLRILDSLEEDEGQG